MTEKREGMEAGKEHEGKKRTRTGEEAEGKGRSRKKRGRKRMKSGYESGEKGKKYIKDLRNKGWVEE